MKVDRESPTKDVIINSPGGDCYFKHGIPSRISLNTCRAFCFNWWLRRAQWRNWAQTCFVNWRKLWLVLRCKESWINNSNEGSGSYTQEGNPVLLFRQSSFRTVLDGFRAIHQQKKQHLNIWWKQVSIRLPPREGDVTKEKLETFEKMVMQK